MWRGARKLVNKPAQQHFSGRKVGVAYFELFDADRLVSGGEIARFEQAKDIVDGF